MPQLLKLVTMEEVSEHNSKDNCWIVIDGKVYDVSEYLDDHPGGDDVLLAATGRDATEDFDDAGHSKSARELMETFCVGEVDTSVPPEPEKPCAQKLVEMTKRYWFVPVVVGSISAVVGFLYLRKKQ